MNNMDEYEPVYLFGGDLLTGPELQGRLENAQEVVKGLTARLDAANDAVAMQKLALEHQRGIVDRLIIDMRDLARDLSRVAGDTHREKNETILAVIYRLLSAEMGRRITQGMDDVPF